MATEQELFEPGEYLQPSGRPGYFSVLAKPSGTMRQASYELQHLPTIIDTLNPDADAWITQAVFTTGNRRAVNLRDVGVLFVDLDTYRCAGLAGKTPEEQVALLLLFCGQEGLPEPSIILFSGRGLQAKWLLSEAVEPVALFEWNQVQMALVKLLEPFAADVAARDVSRVLRVDRTTNTKSGERCRVVHVLGGVESCVARYDFQDLREQLVNQQIQLLPKEEKKKAGTRPLLSLSGEFNFKRLNWYRLFDLRDLWALRGGVSDGCRELTLFWQLNFLLRAEPGRSADLWKEAEVIAAEIAPGEKFYRNADVSTLYRKAREARGGNVVEFHGRTYPPLYTPRNQTLIEIFQITADEEQRLRTIISRQERERRRREKRRAEGMLSREEYLKAVSEDSIERQRPWDQEGISRRWWYELRRRGQ